MVHITISCNASLTGIHLMEKLVQYPSLHVHSWNLPDGITRPVIRDILVIVRQLGLANIVLMTNEGNVADMVLSEVCIFGYDRLLANEDQWRLMFHPLLHNWR